jgi:hypothetical protein
MMGAVDPGSETHAEVATGEGSEDLSALSRRQLLRLAARAPDSYVLLLVLLLADYITLSVDWTGSVSLVFRSFLFALTVLLAFHTSRVGVVVQNAVRVLVVATLLAAVGVAISGGDEANGAVTMLTSLLIFACPVAIGWRIMHHDRVTGETIAGAVCIYILIGMIFATFDYGIQLVSGSDFFSQSGHHILPDFAYFSYITMSTVGYGDLTPAFGVPRTMAVMEALVGQVFLVVLLARLVSLYNPLGWRRGLEERLVKGEQASGSGPAAGPAGPVPGPGPGGGA